MLDDTLTCDICGFDARDEDELTIHREDCEAMQEELDDEEWQGE